MPTQRINGHTYVIALLTFIGSRLILLFAISFSAKFIPQKSGGEYWNVGPSWIKYLLRYDSGWYLKIAVEGYTYDGDNLIQQPVVFYPLYPLIAKILAKIIVIDQTIAVLLVSNTSIVVAILLLCKLVKDSYGDVIALHTVALLSFFPASLFFSAGYTESLALLITVVFFLLLNSKRIIPAALCSGLAAATRLTGIVLLLPLLWQIWTSFPKGRKWLTVYTAAYIALVILLATSGLWLYMVYLWVNFNHPLAFMTAQRAWHKNDNVGNNFFKAVTLQPFYHLSDIFHIGIETYTLDPWFFLIFLLLACFMGKRLLKPHRIYSIGVLLLPYLTLSGTSGFKSFTRYIVLAFPVFIIMADLLKQSRVTRLVLIVSFAVILFVYTAMFAQWYWVG